MKLISLTVLATLISASAFAHHGETYNTLIRVPPIMPFQTYQSGYCCMLYDINRNGDVLNVRAPYCTEAYLAEPSKIALRQWKYGKTKTDGSPVASKNLDTFMSFVLTDMNGKIIPGSNGFMSELPDGSRRRHKPCGLLTS